MTDRDPIFLIEHYDPKENFAWQTVNAEWTRRNVIEGICDGILDCVTDVWEIRKDERTCRNVSTYIALAVEDYLVRNNIEFSYKVLTFLQQNGIRQYQMEAE